MDNQHKIIKGYRDLTQTEIDLINDAKELEKSVNQFLDKLKDINDQQIHDAFNARHLSIAKTHIETGFMFLIKSIAKPTSF